MAHFIYVDYSNLCLAHGASIAHVFDDSGPLTYMQPNAVDFEELYEVLNKSGEIVARCLLIGSKTSNNDPVVALAEKAGFECIFYLREENRPEKKVDVALASHLISDAYTRGRQDADTFTLVSGDSDFVPAVEILTHEGFQVEIAFWKSASYLLKQVATIFTPLDEHLTFCGHGGGYTFQNEAVAINSFPTTILNNLKL